MRIYKLMLLAFAFLAQTAAAQISGYEYWFDGDYVKRTFVTNSDGKVVQELDVSHLVPGVHRYNFRALDGQSRWSNVFSRYFIRMGEEYPDNRVTACEYTIDNGEWKSCDITGGVVDLELPVENLVPGVHRLIMRFCDSGGRWSNAFSRYFVHMGKSYSGNEITACEYAIDNGNWQSCAITGGVVDLELPTDGMSYGLHRFTFRAQDAGGRWSAPHAKYFVKVEPSLSDNKVTAYEYWFNSGSTTRVYVTPANPFSADDLVVNIEGVVPNTVSDDYTVDWSTSTASCPDNLLFGIRFGDDADNWSEARVDTFAYDVPVKLYFQPLAFGDSSYIAQPEAGRIYAYELNAGIGDSLVWNIGGVCRMDVYNEKGDRLYRLNSDKGALEYETEVAEKGRLFALLYNAKSDSTLVSCHRVFTTDIESIEERGVNIEVGDGRVTVSGAEGWCCSVSNVKGYVMEKRSEMKNSETFVLTQGVYVLTLNDGNGYKFTHKIGIK